MKIVGYSERGAMNALFYGMAFNKDERKGEKDMQSFLELAKVPNYNHYHQFEVGAWLDNQIPRLFLLCLILVSLDKYIRDKKKSNAKHFERCLDHDKRFGNYKINH